MFLQHELLEILLVYWKDFEASKDDFIKLLEKFKVDTPYMYLMLRQDLVIHMLWNIMRLTKNKRVIFHLRRFCQPGIADSGHFMWNRVSLVNLTHIMLCLFQNKSKIPFKMQLSFWNSDQSCVLYKILFTVCSWLSTKRKVNLRKPSTWCQIILYEPRHEKTCLQGFWPAKTQTSLISYRD